MKRKLGGVAVMFAVAIVLGEVLPLPAAAHWWLLPATAGLVGAGLGGYVAQRGFVPVALAVHVLVWAAILVMLGSVAGAQASIVSLLSQNKWAMALSFPAVAVGAFLGQQLAKSLASGPARARA